MNTSTKSAVYTHGHHESVLRSHSWRTALNSCAYLLPHLLPTMHILDIGCGPGTITADLASLVPQGHVTGLEHSPDPLPGARATAAARGLTNIDFTLGDIHVLPFPDNSFDVVHAHQVLQHIGDPIKGLSEMRRVAKPGGIVATREADFAAMTWFPEVLGMKEWRAVYERVARSNGGEPNAGRMLHMWARKAGFDKSAIKCTAGTWCYSTREEIEWWSGLWADRTVASSFAKSAKDNGIADDEELARISQVWRDWGIEEDAWFVVMHGEIVCTV